MSRLLGLLGLDLSKLLLAAALVGLGTSLGVEHVVPPAEARGVVANELLVVHVVVVGAGPDGEEVAQAPGEVEAAVGVDSLEEAEDDPDVHGQEVQVTGDAEVGNGRSDDTDAEEHGLNGRGILGSEAEGSRVGVVHLVDGLVQGAVVQSAMEPVVPGVLHDEEDGDLVGHLVDGREGDAVLDAHVGGNGVEEPNLGELGGEVTDEDNSGAIPLLLERRHLLVLDLELLEVGDLVHDHEGQASAEVDDLVHDEADDASREGVVLHVQVPRGPEALGVRELNIVLGDLFEHVEVGLGLVEGTRRGVAIGKRNKSARWNLVSCVWRVGELLHLKKGTEQQLSVRGPNCVKSRKGGGEAFSSTYTNSMVGCARQITLRIFANTGPRGELVEDYRDG